MHDLEFLHTANCFYGGDFPGDCCLRDLRVLAVAGAGISRYRIFHRQRERDSNGADPEVIETEVVEPLEEQLNTIEGIKTIRSTSRAEVGTITVDFELYRDIDIAAQDVRESFFYLTVTICFTIVFVYLVLSAQFESFLHPFTILLTLALATVGASGVLYALGMTLNIFSFIGLILLVGLVNKTGILLVDYANVLRAQGHGLQQAAREAAHTRFRLVIITASSTVLGMLPIALGFGAGGNARAPMGVMIALGNFVSTALTLLVILVAYILLSHLQEALSRNRTLRWSLAAAGGGGAGGDGRAVALVSPPVPQHDYSWVIEPKV
jgi:multidrug efflux pump subunit AcrB